jgi:hypothetical protein
MNPYGTKKSLASRLGNIISKENINNSYYNDEYYTPCKTADYNKAYEEILNEDGLSQEDLKETFPFKCEETKEKVNFDLVAILKMVVAGDFGSQYKTTSSIEKNLSAINHLYDLSSKSLTPEEHKSLWDHKVEIPKEKRGGFGSREYQTNHLKAISLSEMAARRFDFYNLKTKGDLQIAHKVAKKLLKFNSFKEAVSETYRNDACTNLINSAENEEEKKEIISTLNQLAISVKSKAYENIANVDHYDQRRIAINSLLFGRSHDTYFDKLLDSLEGIENNISKRGKTLDISM